MTGEERIREAIRECERAQVPEWETPHDTADCAIVIRAIREVMWTAREEGRREAEQAQGDVEDGARANTPV